MGALVHSIVRPEMLVWARRTARLAPERLARKLGVKPETVLSWESGRARPTIGQVRAFARACQRPMAALYLPEPPSEPPIWLTNSMFWLCAGRLAAAGLAPSANIASMVLLNTTANTLGRHVLIIAFLPAKIP